MLTQKHVYGRKYIVFLLLLVSGVVLYGAQSVSAALDPNDVAPGAGN